MCCDITSDWVHRALARISLRILITNSAQRVLQIKGTAKAGYCNFKEMQFEEDKGVNCVRQKYRNL
jgi:hypothetical protein